jgi:hypothetical protein
MFPAKYAVYKLVQPEVFFRVHYVSIAASYLKDFPTSSNPSKFCGKKRKERVVIKPFHYGSLVVDEELLGDDHTKLSPETSAKVLETAIQIKNLPELYINDSIKVQLERQLNGKPYTVRSQIAGKELLPYNLYFNSHPDLVIQNNTTNADSSLVAVDVEAEAASDSDSESEDEFDDINWVSELKKKSGGQAQLYAEAFNVATTSVAEQVSRNSISTINKVCVYCILLTQECRRGLLSRMILDFQEGKCLIEEEGETRPSHECFDIALNQ